MILEIGIMNIGSRDATNTQIVDVLTRTGSNNKHSQLNKSI